METSLTRWKRTAFPVLIIIIGVAVFFAGISEAADKNAFKIGFVGGLTGKSSDLGIQGRNGVTLAVEEINRQGGINGRPVQLITKDDLQDTQTALRVDRELIDEGVVVIIGHMTSALSMAALPLVNEKKIPLLSPTTSTDKLTGIDDYFLRVISPSIQMINFLVDYAFRNLKLRRIAVVYDLSNRAYSEEYEANFKSEFERLGGQVVAADSFNAGPDVSFKDLARKILQARSDGLLVIAGALDTAMICQHVRMAGSKKPILISGWAQTPDLLRHGGPAVEGIIGAMHRDLDSTEKPYVAFKERFRTRFGTDEPSFAAIFGYEAVLVVKEALSKNPDPKKLKETILGQKTFNGLHGVFEIDPYGDAKRTTYIMMVRKNRLTIVNK